MTTLARTCRDFTLPRLDPLAVVAAALLVGGCGNEGETPPPQASPSQADCLILVWQKHPSRDEAFDRANDAADGGAISCATGASASQFADALAAIRAAAASGDRARLLDQLGMPLLYIDAQGNRREVRRDELAEALFDEVFDPATIALLSRVRLHDLTVVAGEGAFVELGSVWLVVDRTGGQPRIATVNRQALGEAMEAARRAAESGATSPAPMERWHAIPRGAERSPGAR